MYFTKGVLLSAKLRCFHFSKLHPQSLQERSALTSNNLFLSVTKWCLSVNQSRTEFIFFCVLDSKTSSTHNIRKPYVSVFNTGPGWSCSQQDGEGKLLLQQFGLALVSLLLGPFCTKVQKKKRGEAGKKLNKTKTRGKVGQ